MSLQDDLQQTAHKLELAEQELARRRLEVDLLKQRLAAAERLRKAAEERRLSIEPVAGEYLSLANSRAWRVVEFGWRLKRKLAPAGSNRAKWGKRFAKVLWRAAKSLRQAPPPANQAASDGQQPVQEATSAPAAAAPPVSVALTSDYPGWAERHSPNAAELEAQREESRVFGYRPLISILTPLYQTPPAILAATLESVLRQTYDHWELCLVDASAPDAARQKVLDEYTSRDSRIRLERLTSNLGIAENTNAALRLARGEFVALLDHDDELAPHALHAYVKLLNDNPETDIFYSDEDKLDSQGRHCHPFFKPDWSPEYFRGVMYVGHLLCFRRSLIDRAGQFDRRYDGVQDFEFMLRLSEVTSRIRHVPQILYHWRQIPGSISEDSRAKPNICELQRAAVNAHLARVGLPAQAELASENHRLRFTPLAQSEPGLVSIIIPSKDAPEYLENCLRTIFERSTYPNYEVLVVDNDTSDPRALEVMARYPIKRVHLPGRFNYSRANNLGVEHARGAYLLFLNNDTEVVTPDWIEHLVYYGAQADVGAVGAMLLYSDRTVQHAGVILGPRGTADHLMRGFPSGTDGYAGSLLCAREASAVTAACLLMKRSDFAAIGGFSEHYFTHYQDVELCLRLRRLGRRNIFTPSAELIHHESKTRKSYYDFVDYTLLLDQWQTEIENGDPYYNPNFDLARTDYGIRP